MRKESQSGIVIAFKIGRHQQDRIIHTKGVSPTIPAGYHLNAQWMNLILVYEENDNSVTSLGVNAET